MKRILLYIAVAVAVILLILVAGAYWLVGTTSGARFALTTLPAVAGLDISFRGIDGRLADRLRLTGVRLRKGKLEARIANLDLKWEPRRLLSRELLVHQLTASGVQVQDDTPLSKKAPEFAWPQLGAVARRFSAKVESFRVKGIYYRHLQGSPLIVNEVSSSLTYDNGLLSLPDISLLSPEGRARGEIAMGLWRPSLRLDLSAVPAKPVQGMDLFSLQGRLSPGRSPEIVAGPIAAAGRSGGAQRLELTTELGITPDTYNFRKLTLIRPGRRGAVTGAGSVKLTTAEPVFDLALNAKDLDLEKELKHPARVTGSVRFKGTPSSYVGSFALTNVGRGWESGTLASDFKGGKSGVKLAPVNAAVLDGKISGALDILWSKGTQIRGTLSGRKLNPGRLAAEWRGVVNLDLAGSFNLPEKGEARGELRGKLLESRLHGQDLRGEVAGAFAGKNVRIDRLFLAGRGFDLRASGELERRIGFVARVSDLSRLIPGTAGRINADGWLRYRDGMIAAAATGEGSNIAASGARVAAVSFKAGLGEGKDYPVHLDAALAGIAVGQGEVEKAHLTVNGTASRHTVDAYLASAGSEARVALAGGVEKGVWRGYLNRFSGQDGVGPWNLAAPAALAVSSSGFRVTPLVINGLPGERLEFAAAMDLHPLTGDIKARWNEVNLARGNYWLQGVQLSGGSSGDVNMRLLSRNRMVLAGRVDVHGRMVRDGQSVSFERVTANLDGGEQGLRAALDLILENGSGDAHLLFTSPGPATLSVPEQGDLRLQMANFDLALLRPFLPPDLYIVGRMAGVVSGRLLPGRRLDLRGNAALDGGHVAWRQETQAFDASISAADLAFNWRGEASGAKARAGILELNVRAAANGVYTAKGEQIVISRCDLRIDADQGGSRAAFDLGLQQGGTLRAAVTSSSPASLGIPETAEFTMAWGGIDPQQVKAFLPGALNLSGELGGEARGRLMPGQRLELTGVTEFTQGRARWQGSSGELNARVRSATLDFAWRDETLSGKLDLALAEYGKAQGNFVLPVPARLPVVPNEQGAVQGAFAGRVQEHGFLTALMPGLVQESHGDLDLDLRLGGIWRDPLVTGRLQLTRAGAYLPSAGITVSDVQLLAVLEHDMIRIDNFSAVSGKGKLAGNMLVRLNGFEVEGYSGAINGDRFQTVYLPELQMVTSPGLTFEGDADTVTVKGTVNVPEMLVLGPPTRTTVEPSSDVILEGAPRETGPKERPILVQGRIHVALGDKVQVKASGVDAQLGGGMDLVLNGLDNITSSGEIRVVKGSYKAYGLELEIIRGRLYYTDDPVNRPTLDILALRTIGDVEAGVTVGGYLNAPVVKLYSEPSMPEVDILAYMVLGHPLSSTSTDQASMVATAATSLLSFGQGEGVQEQIKERLGLSVLGLTTVDQSSAGRMGYREIAVSPTGAARPRQAESESLLTVGKYLTPKIYLSYGRSLVTGGSLFMLRYDISRHWQLETQSGTESGADIYYKLEFD